MNSTNESKQTNAHTESIDMTETLVQNYQRMVEAVSAHLDRLEEKFWGDHNAA